MDLKGKTVFIDSSVFIGQNFLDGKLIGTFLSPDYTDYFEIVMPKITVEEIKSNFKRRAERAIEKHGQLINNRSLDEHGKKIFVDVLKNSETAEKLIRRMPKLPFLVKEFSEKLDNVLAEANVKILDYPTIDTSQIFDDYFNAKPPFGSAKKKSEFPDAFAIAQVEKYGEETGKNILVFSDDKDFHSRISKSITVVKDYKVFIEELLGVTRFKKMEEMIRIGIDIDKHLVAWLEDELNDETIYTDIVNYMEIYDITVNDTIIVDREFEIIGGDKEHIEVKATVKVDIDVDVTIDDEDTGIYDSEDKVMLFVEQKDMEVKQTLEIPATLIFHIDDDEIDEDFEVEDINNGKSLELESPYYY